MKMKKSVSWVEPTQDYEEAFARFVPNTGRADTEQGEILRCGSRVIYRFYNDGDKYNIGYGMETVNPALNYLIRCSDSKISGIASEIVKYINNVLVSNGLEPSGGLSRDMFYFDDEADEIFDAISDDEYDRLLHKLGDALNEYASRLVNEEAEDRSYYASTKKSKMRKGMDIDGVFDDSYQPPHGKYVLHLNLNGDSFYPKYFDDEESFNREVQRAIDNGYTESDWSNYSDNEGLHRRFARDDWGKSAKKSYTPDYMDFRSMVDSIKNTGNHNKVFKE